MPEAAVTACYQHGEVAAVLLVAGATGGDKLGIEEEEDGSDGDDADHFSEEENGDHAAEVSVNYVPEDCLFICTLQMKFRGKTEHLPWHVENSWTVKLKI